MIINHNIIEFANCIKGLNISTEMSDKEILPLAISIEQLYSKLTREITNEVDFVAVYNLLVPPINKFLDWCYKNKPTEVQSILKNTLQLTKALIIETAQPYVYKKEQELEDLHKKFGASELINQIPKGFNSLRGYKIFKSMLSRYKDETEITMANFSFVYYSLDKDGFINMNGVGFRAFLADNYNIHFDRINSRYKENGNDRIHFYNNAKEIYK